MSGAKFNLRGKMTVTVHSARGLSNKELVGKMDPFTVITVSGSKDEKFKTKIAKDQHQTPVWEQSYIFNLEGKEELLHCNVWNEATLGDDHIGRLDLTLDALDMSGKPRWYQIKDKQNFTKQTGEVSMTIVFDGTGLPAGSLAYTTHQSRVAPAAASPAAATPVSPAPIVQAAPMPSPVATVAPPVVQQQQQPNYQQAPPQQQQPMYHSQPQQQYHSQPQQPQYSQQPQYAPAPVYQQPPAPVYQQAPMQPIVYQQPAPVQYQQMPVAQPVYQQAQPVYQQQPTVTFQPAPQTVFVQQPAPAVVYQQVGGYPGQVQAPRGQLIGYFPNGQPRYA